MSKITSRNPFTSLSNYSFLRNLNKIQSPQSRIKSSSYSSEKKYFDYNQSYFHDRFLNQQNYCKRSSRKIEKDDYIQPAKWAIDLKYLPASKNEVAEEYYNVDNYKSISNARTSDYGTNSNDFMKSSSMDMFDSDFFHNRSKGEQIEKKCFVEEIPSKRISLTKKDNSQFRFKNQIQKDTQMVQQNSSMEESQQISELQTTNKSIQQIPQTIFLENKKKIFHLYHYPEEDDE